MAAPALDLYQNGVGRGIDRTGLGADRAPRQIRMDMHGHHGRGLLRRQFAGLQQGHRTGRLPFLGRLEDRHKGGREGRLPSGVRP
ncbi:hypothetical protein GCM10020001_060630 [Nonomuraea salmonea]